MFEPERTIFELTDRVARLEKALADMATDSEAVKRNAAIMDRALKAADERLRALEPCPKYSVDLEMEHFSKFVDGTLRCRDCGVRIWPPANEEER